MEGDVSVVGSLDSWWDRRGDFRCHSSTNRILREERDQFGNTSPVRGLERSLMREEIGPGIYIPVRLG
jgi:hypothetical protein